MSGYEIIKQKLELIDESITFINHRMENIKQPDDFVKSLEGITILDSIAMRLQIIGENVKKLDKTNPRFLKRYEQINWNLIINFRDFISHHYERTDH